MWDIWPEAIAALGVVNNYKIIRLLEKVKLFLYRQSDLIITVTYSFKAELERRGVPSGKIRVVFSGVDLARYKPLAEKYAVFLGYMVRMVSLMHRIITLMLPSFS